MEEATGLYRRDVTIGREGKLSFAETVRLRQEASPDTPGRATICETY